MILSERRVNLGISTGSLFPGTIKDAPKLISAELTTKHVISGARQFAQTVERATPPELEGIVHPGVSFHWSDKLDAQTLVHELQQHSIQISTHDIPDLESFPAFIGKVIAELRHNPTHVLSATKNHAGWYAMNTANEWTRMQRLSEAMKATRGVNPYSELVPLTIIRGNISMFTETHQIDDFRRNLARYPNLALALEIDAHLMTPSQYIELVRQMNSTRRYGIPVYADIDLGHMEESRTIHTESETPDVNEFLARLLSGSDAYLVATVSLNQYNRGIQTHVWLGDQDGIVDINRTGRVIYQNQSRLAIPFQPTVTIETHPADSARLFGPEGQKILESFLSNFTNSSE